MTNSKIKNVIIACFVCAIIIALILLRIYAVSSWLASNNSYSSPIEYVNHQYSGYEDWQAKSVVYQYENKKQAFFIIQTNDMSFIEINMKVHYVSGEKYYEFKESTQCSDIGSPVIVTWQESGMFKYFAVKDPEYFDKYAGDETPTQCDEFDYTTSDGKQHHCYFYIIDPLAS